MQNPDAAGALVRSDFRRCLALGPSQRACVQRLAVDHGLKERRQAVRQPARDSNGE